MGASRARRPFAVAVALMALLLLPAVAGAQTPMPGESPEPVQDWVWYLSWPVILGTIGLVGLIGLSYLRLASRFYAKEEPPKVRRQPVYAGVNAPAYPAPAPQAAPAPVTPAQSPSDQTPAPAATQPQAEAAAQATQVEERPAQEGQPSAAPPAEAPAPEKPPEEKPPEEKPEPAPAERKAAPDDDVYERVLREQLDKGVSPKVAEGRAKAAALKASRQAGGG